MAANTTGKKAVDRRLIGRFWKISRGFWNRPAGPAAWVLTVVLLAIVLAQLYVQYRINIWNKALFDALEGKNSTEVLAQALIYIPLVCGSVLLMVAAVYGRMTMQRRWREWITNHAIDRWLTNGRYYHLNLVEGDHENPEYRIGEDARIATDAPVDFSVGILSAFLTAITFTSVLWFVGGALDITVAGRHWHIPGFLVIAALIYSILATGSTILIGRQFVHLSELNNQAEANFRYTLTRLRENGESIALLGGEKEERAGINRSFEAVLQSWRAILGQYLRNTFVSHSSYLIASVVPIILCAPKFLQGEMTLGTVMQVASAFTTVQIAFSWLVDNYPRFAGWSASARRITSLFVSIEALDLAEQQGGIKRITRSEHTAAALHLKGVSIKLDDGTGLVSETEVEIAPGEKVLIVGESGSGKSTLVRAIAGLWPWGEGEVVMQKNSRLFMLPQRPYVPIGSLRRAATYPLASETVSDKDLFAALEKVGLGHLEGRIDEEGQWEQTLSGGEKQRLAFARLLIHKPDLIVMDEATSALDQQSQERLMTLIGEDLPNATLISVGHRPELEAYHNRKLVLEHKPGGARLVRDEYLTIVPGRGVEVLRRFFKRRRPAAPKTAVTEIVIPASEPAPRAADGTGATGAPNGAGSKDSAAGEADAKTDGKTVSAAVKPLAPSP